MKNLIKNLKFQVAVFLAMILAVLPALGETVTQTLTSGVPTNLVATAGSITKITLSGTSGTVKVQFFDSSTVSLTYVIGAYTNYNTLVYTNTTTYVDILGATNTNSFKYSTNVPTTVAQSTNTFKSLGAFSAPAGETVEIQYGQADPFFRGVTVTNNGAINVTVNYLPWR